MTCDDDASARAAAIRAARTSYGRLVSIVAASSGDLAAAEDALADAFERALRSWPQGGVPDSPEGWLLTVARNRLKDVWKSAAHRTNRPLDTSDDVTGPAELDDLDIGAIPDRQLELLFTCAHPAIDATVRAPLMLQVILGFEATDLARLYAVSPTAMAQRLVRAKKRIKQLRVPFVVPDQSAMPERMSAVLDAVYGCFTLAAAADDPDIRALTSEADYLATLLADLLANSSEAAGLAALIALARSRERPVDAPYVPLDQQNPDDWDAALIERGEASLRRAAAPAVVPGRFQLEAAIQAVHAARRSTGRIDWAALETLHRALLQVTPTLGAQVALAAVLLRGRGAAAALEYLDLTVPETDYQPWHAVRARALASAGNTREALIEFEAAIRLADNPSVREYLVEQRRQIIDG